MKYTKILIISIISFSFFTIGNSFGQDSESTNEEIDIIGKIGDFLFNDPLSQIIKPFQEGKAFEFILFISGLAGFSIFVWYFYRFISRRELIPRFHKKEMNASKIKFLTYVILNITCFPIIVFVWFSLYSSLIFLLAIDLPFNLIAFVSMALIGVIRITSYFKEELARDVGKTIPFAMLGMVLTAGTLFADPNFLSYERITAAIIVFQNKIPSIVDAIIIISIIEGILRGSFFIKSRFFPKLLKNIKRDKKDID